MSDYETTPVTWVLEAEVFPETHTAMRDAVLAAHHQVLLWKDDWLHRGRWPSLDDRAVVFHGSLGNADAVARRSLWRPGAFCNTDEFRCSSWYPHAARWLLHRRWEVVPAKELVSNPDRVLASIGSMDSVFVRPDSPLKSFSGRVLRRDAISLRALDHGFYYDDEMLAVVIAPVRRITREWRYVVVSGEVVAGSAYVAERRASSMDAPDGAPWRFAADVARDLNPPEAVYVLDVCESDGDLHVLELNPFSGADLYACDRRKVVDAVSKRAALMLGTPGRRS